MLESDLACRGHGVSYIAFPVLFAHVDAPTRIKRTTQHIDRPIRELPSVRSNGRESKYARTRLLTLVQNLGGMYIIEERLEWPSTIKDTRGEQERGRGGERRKKKPGDKFPFTSHRSTIMGIQSDDGLT